MSRPVVIPVERIQRAVQQLRGHNVLLDADLAALYAVETKALVRAVKRNLSRFPADFMFQLTPSEIANLRCQIVTSSSWGGRRYRPYAFTEQGVAMLSSVLHSRRAVGVNIEIMRTFVRLRRMLVSNAELVSRLDVLEKRYDTQFKAVFDAIRELMDRAPASSARIGFSAPAAQGPAARARFRAAPVRLTAR